MFKWGSIFGSLNRDNITKKLLTQTAFVGVLKGLGYGAGYLLALIITSNSGAHGYGIYSLTISILGLLTVVASLGFRTSIVRFVAQTDNRDTIARIYRCACYYIFSTSMVLSVILFFFAEHISISLFNASYMTFPLQCMGILFFPLVLESVNVEMIRALNMVALSEYLKSLNNPMFCCAILFVLPGLTEMTDTTVIVAFYAASIIAFVFSLYVIMQRVSVFQICDDNQTRGLSCKRLLFTSLPMMTTSITAFFLSNLGSLLIGMYYSPKEVGVFQVAAKLALATGIILLSVNTVVAPMFSRLFWNHQFEELKRLIYRTTMLIFILSAPIQFLLIIFPEIFLSYFGLEFESAKTTLIFLAVGQFFNIACGSVGTFLNMTGKERIFQKIVLTALGLNVLLSIFLIPRYGIDGAAFAGMMTVIYWNVVAAYYIHKEFGLKMFFWPTRNQQRFERI